MAVSQLTAALTDADFRLIAESIPHIVWTTTADGSTDYFNRRGTEYTGEPAETYYGFGWLSLVHPDDAPRARAAWHNAHVSREFLAEFRLRRHDGVYRWFEVRGLPVNDGHGTTVKWIGTCTDIEDRRRLEQELRTSQRQTLETVTLLETLQASAPVGFMFVDRSFRYVRVNDQLATINGLSADRHIGRRVADVVPDLWPAIEHTYQQVLAGGEPVTNVEMTGSTAAEPGGLRHWLVNYYPVRVQDQIIGIGVVVTDITDRKRSEDERSQFTRAAVAAMAATVEARDPYTAGHQRRVAEISLAVGQQLGVDPKDLEGIELAASIHDIGKIAIPAEILSRPSVLRDAELALVKTHSRAGYDIVSGIAFPWPIADMILQHHERVDGSGYPDGLLGDEITFGARIIAVADTVEAMASHRPYRPALAVEEAMHEIRTGRGVRYDADVVDALHRALAAGPLPLGVDAASPA